MDGRKWQLSLFYQSPGRQLSAHDHGCGRWLHPKLGGQLHRRGSGQSEYPGSFCRKRRRTLLTNYSRKHEQSRNYYFHLPLDPSVLEFNGLENIHSAIGGMGIGENLDHTDEGYFTIMWVDFDIEGEGFRSEERR